MNLKNITYIVLCVVLSSLLLSACNEQPPEPLVPPDKEAASKLYPAYKQKDDEKVWGFIDDKGQFAIEPRWNIVGYFLAEGYAVVVKEQLKGIVNTKGQLLIQPKYKEVIPGPGAQIVGVREDGWNELVDLSGKLIYESETPIRPVDEGWAIIQEYREEVPLYGYLDDTGSIVIEPIYLAATPFSEEHAVVKVGENKYQVIDKTSKMILEFEAVDVQDPREGYFSYQAKTKNDPLWGYRDMNGKIAVKASFAEVTPFVGGLAVVGQKQKGEIKYGIIDRKGKFIIRPKYGAIRSLGNGYFAVSRTGETEDAKDHLIAVFDSQGKRLTDYVYTKVNGCGNEWVSVSDGLSTSLVGADGKNLNGFPQYVGSGSFTPAGTMIVANVDDEMIYLTHEGKELWRSPDTENLEYSLKLKQNKFRPDAGHLIYYPQMEGHEDVEIQNKINGHLKQAFTSEGALGVLDGSATVRYGSEINKDLLIVKAHGNAMDQNGVERELLRYIHINIKTGDLYTLADLFKQDNTWRGLIPERVKVKLGLEENEEGQSPNIFTQFEDSRPFKAGKYGIEVYYYNQELGADEKGYKKIVIPYTELLQDIVTGSPFWNAYLKQDM